MNGRISANDRPMSGPKKTTTDARTSTDYLPGIGGASSDELRISERCKTSVEASDDYNSASKCSDHLTDAQTSLRHRSMSGRLSADFAKKNTSEVHRNIIGRLM